MSLKAPFPYFGGKSAIAAVVWEALGDPPNYVEPFLGSGAVLLGRPHEESQQRLETVNDLDGLICNFWRALQAEPETVAAWADWPANENDLHARHAWLVGQKDSLQTQLEGDPHYYDAKIAGWWVWGMSLWIGGEFCSGKGPWHVQQGQLQRRQEQGQIGNSGQGVHRKRIQLGNSGQGVQQGAIPSETLQLWMQRLATRLRHVRVCCGDWTRILGHSPTIKNGLTGVFLDPPYNPQRRNAQLYRIEASLTADIQAWCLRHGTQPQLRIALCGYDGEYALPGWRIHAWKTQGGYSNRGETANPNRTKERIWLSPHCLQPNQLDLFQ